VCVSLNLMQPIPQQIPVQQYASPQVIGGIPSQGYAVPQGMMIAVLPTNGSATAGMVLGIVSMSLSVLSPLTFFMCCFVSIPLAIAGVIASHIGLSSSKTIGVGNGQAIAGLVLNWLQILMIFIPIMAFTGTGFVSTLGL